MTHDYKRNGTTTLFAALGHCKARSWAKTIPDIGTRSFCASFADSMPSSLTTSRCI